MNILSIYEAYYIIDFDRFFKVAPMMWVVSTELHVGSTGSLLHTGLSHFERVLLVTNRLFQGVNEHLGLVDLLKGLKERREMCLDMLTC